MPVTNRGKLLLLQLALKNTGISAQFYFALMPSGATSPTVDTNTLSELTELPAGNGYTAGGLAVARTSGGFPTFTENDTTDIAEVTIADQVWTASGGTLPSSGLGPGTWLLLTDEATPGNRQVIAYDTITPVATVSSGQTYTVSGAKISLTPPA